LSIVPSTSIESTSRQRTRLRVQPPAFRPLQIECEAPRSACAYVRCDRGRHQARGLLRAVEVSATIPENLARRRFDLTDAPGAPLPSILVSDARIEHGVCREVVEQASAPRWRPEIDQTDTGRIAVLLLDGRGGERSGVGAVAVDVIVAVALHRPA